MSPAHIPPGTSVALRFMQPGAEPTTTEVDDAPEMRFDYGPALCEHPKEARVEQWLNLHDGDVSYRSTEPVTFCGACDLPMLGPSKRVKIKKVSP